MINKNNEQIGKVVSAKNDKTITVLVTNTKMVSKYNKRVKSSKKFTAHDEENLAKEGDTVRIVGCKPMSKMKRYVLAEVIEKAVIL